MRMIIVPTHRVIVGLHGVRVQGNSAYTKCPQKLCSLLCVWFFVFVFVFPQHWSRSSSAREHRDQPWSQLTNMPLFPLPTALTDSDHLFLIVRFGYLETVLPSVT